MAGLFLCFLQLSSVQVILATTYEIIKNTYALFGNHMPISCYESGLMRTLLTRGRAHTCTTHTHTHTHTLSLSLSLPFFLLSIFFSLFNTFQFPPPVLTLSLKISFPFFTAFSFFYMLFTPFTFTPFLSCSLPFFSFFPSSSFSPSN